jgi:hypothetical protein
MAVISLTRHQWRKAIRERGACERCGRTERLHAHHIDRDPSNNTLENGELLCVWCHDDEHEMGGRLVAWMEAARRATGHLGHPHSKEAKRKMSKAHTGTKRAATQKEAMREAALAAWAPGGARRTAHERNT